MTDLNSSGDKIRRETVDCVVIGAGVVGISIARELSLRGRRVVVLESSSTFGAGASSRNSQVIHAGIYYPPNSLKTLLCVKGREMMLKYCSDRGVPLKQIGKLIVATRESEIPKLEELFDGGKRNGVEGLRLMDPYEVARLEPEVKCVKAIYSPLSGIVNAYSLMLSLMGDAENHGAKICYDTTVIGGHLEPNNQIHLQVAETRNLEEMDGGNLPQPDRVLVANIVVNAAGLASTDLARRFTGVDPKSIPITKLVRGSYFTLSMENPPFRHLIYPIPEEGGLGIHVTLDLDGHVKFGPDVEWIDALDAIPTFMNKFDYYVSPDRASHFCSEVKKYFPNLKDESLEAAFSGIRPKLVGTGKAPADFVIRGEHIHGVHGLVNLYGIDSPGLTSCLAIADHVVSMLLPADHT